MSTVTDTLARWNFVSAVAASNEILPCCGSWEWAKTMAARRPFANEDVFLDSADEIWRGLLESDWLEALGSHPRIGESRIGSPAESHQVIPQSAAWSDEEQRKVSLAEDSAKLALAEGNQKYETRFKRIFIVCASGKSAQEILDILRRRLENDPQVELQEAVEEQRKITRIRLKKWLRGPQ